MRIFSRKGQEKDERAKQIEAEYVAKLEKNLGDEIRILTDERLKRLEAILGNKEVLADLHDERTNKRLLTKGAHRSIAKPSSASPPRTSSASAMPTRIRASTSRSMRSRR